MEPFGDWLRLVESAFIFDLGIFFWSLKACKAAANILAPFLYYVLFKGFLLKIVFCLIKSLVLK
jgi:hypothetical protein